MVAFFMPNTDLKYSSCISMMLIEKQIIANVIYNKT